MLQHVKFVCNTRSCIANDTIKYKLHNSDFHISKKEDEQILTKYIERANEIFNIDTRSITHGKTESTKDIVSSIVAMEKIENILKSFSEILKDDSLIYLLDNINLLTFQEANLIYKIKKIMIVLSKLNYPISEHIHKYLEIHIEDLIQIFYNNLIPSNKDYVIIIMGKLIRKLFQLDSLLTKVLTKDFFYVIYCHTKNEKFVLPQECFKILFHLIDSKKINKKIVSNFLNENSTFIFSVLNSGINMAGMTKQNMQNECLVDDFYYMKRESLILIEKILFDPEYENFTNKYVNNIDNLKMVMMQLNNKCEKIVFQAIDILYYFFLDIEIKQKNIKLILHANKQNFYNFFEKNDEVFAHSTEMMEKENFILYELERLENYLD